MGNDRRTYSPAPPLRIDLRTQENVYTGVAEANYFWRAKLNQSFSWSQPLRELIDDAAYSRVQILVEIYGHVENPNTPNEKRPYMQKIATPVVFGKGQLSAALDATIARFKVSKKVTDAPGYVASGNIIVLTHAIVKLAYTREAEGGALSRANMIEITTSTGERFIAANPPTTASAYAKNVPNACLFRCLHHAIAAALRAAIARIEADAMASLRNELDATRSKLAGVERQLDATKGHLADAENGLARTREELLEALYQHARKCDECARRIATRRNSKIRLCDKCESRHEVDADDPLDDLLHAVVLREANALIEARR
jgi:ribosomal protein L37AE/L43A